MKIEYLGSEEFFIPKAIIALRNLEGIPLFHSEKSFRHPLESYSITFADVFQKTVTLIENLQSIDSDLAYLGNKKQGWEEKLSSDTDNWLDSIIQHIDTCKGILSCFFSKDEEKKKNKCITLFSKEIEQYRKEVATIVNLIKHHQRFVRIIYFHWIGGFVPGYFIEGIFQEGVIGPDPLVHKRGNTAISFNRNLPLHICNILFISNILSQSIYEITKRSISIKNQEPYKNDYLTKALKSLSLSKMIYFPDEIKKPVPYIRWHLKENNEIKILIEMPSKICKISSVPDKCRIQIAMRFGEVYRTYKIPYFGDRVPI